MELGRRKDKASRPWRLSAKLLIVSSVATVIGFSTICASVMIDMRHGEGELARQTLENLASGIDADISRNVELFDLSLRAVARVLNIAWIEEALALPARIICPRSSRCPRPDRCESALPSRAREITDIRAEIIGRAR